MYWTVWRRRAGVNVVSVFKYLRIFAIIILMVTNNPSRLEEAPILVAGVASAVWLTQDGEIQELSLKVARSRIIEGKRPILCHMPVVAGRLGLNLFEAFDVLELFAFVLPATFTIPTPSGLAKTLKLPLPKSLTEEASILRRVTLNLLRQFSELPSSNISELIGTMAIGGWSWGEPLFETLKAENKTKKSGAGLKIWTQLSEWSEYAPTVPPGDKGVDPIEARERLRQLVGVESEDRPSQADYASAVSAAFQPSVNGGAPNMILAEAGTGVGKTLGYLAPASLWAEKNETPVWISTYTRNLQHQIDQELRKLFPNSSERARHVVVRKGRENYLCLLNFENSVKQVTIRKRDAIGLGLLARWALASRDGSMTGGDFPAWLIDLVGRQHTLDLADRRGECVYGSCTHYGKCFIEKNIREARRATLVIANHALVMANATRGRFSGPGSPTRMVFDEGHHVFDAADSAFSAYLSGRETAELRRWLRGAELGTRSRARGLKRRIEGLIVDDDELIACLGKVLKAARSLPGEGWHQRCADARPVGSAEAFLCQIRSYVYSRSLDSGSPYSLECDTKELPDNFLEAASKLEGELYLLERPLRELRRSLESKLDDQASELDTKSRNRIEGLVQSIINRGEQPLSAWRDMLASLNFELENISEGFADWLSVERYDGRDFDVGMHRHWIDPTIPFAEQVVGPAHGVLVTSATLRDGTGDVDFDWRTAEMRTGACHNLEPAIRAEVPSPFDYGALTRVFIVKDVRKDKLDQVAAAYRELFLAAGGGGLGLFTAISRLRAVHKRIIGALDAEGLALYSQHVDRSNLSTLVDIFRAEKNSCLLGTDAVRDGVDVPGESLRMIVFDRVPWPRPTILHRARRSFFGKKQYDDMITRLRLKQAYGRLVRRADDRGVFVMLDPMTPSRLLGAFPSGVEVQPVGLAEAVAETRKFFKNNRILSAHA